MRVQELAMIAFIVALIVASLLFGPQLIGVFFALLLGAIYAVARRDNGHGHGDSFNF